MITKVNYVIDSKTENINRRNVNKIICTVHIPPSGYDIYHLNEKLTKYKKVKAKLYKFRMESATSTKYPLVKEEVGTGILEIKSHRLYANEALLKIDINSLSNYLKKNEIQGLHVLNEEKF